MKTLRPPAGLLSLFLVSLGWLYPITVQAYDDPEDSPLYANSRRQAFAEMADRDRGQSYAAMRTAQIIVVEGARWSYAGGSVRGKPGLPAAGGGQSRPMSITTDLSCTAPTMCTTCYATTCGASCDGSPTCRPYPSCHTPCITSWGPTCVDVTCRGDTCNNLPTCQPFPTCQPVATCGSATCPPTPTCWGATCLGTCNPADCPASLYDVRVPQAGQIQVSFSSSTQLKYTLQSCTDLPAGQWTDVTTATGTGQAMTLSDTNFAPRVFYRLWVQTL